VCFNTMPGKKDINIYLRGAIIIAHRSGKGSKAISKHFGVHYTAAKKIIHKQNAFRTAVNLHRRGQRSNMFSQGQNMQSSEKL